MTDHAAQPTLCQNCLDQIHAKAESCPLNDRVMQLCDHRPGPDCAIVAVGATQNHAIVHWHLEGPMSHAQATTVTLAILRQFDRAGMSLHKIQTQ